MLTPELLGLKDDPEGKKPINVFEISLVGAGALLLLFLLGGYLFGYNFL